MQTLTRKEADECELRNAICSAGLGYFGFTCYFISHNIILKRITTVERVVQAALCLSPCFAFVPKSAIQNVISLLCICNYYAIVDNEPSKSSEEELSLTETKSWWLDERIEACRSTM